MPPPSLHSVAAWLADPRVIWSAAWIGLVILTAGLFFAMRSRWGQRRPMTACVALSIFAHALMLGLAYTTELFVESPIRPPGEATVRVTFVSSDRPEANTQPPASPQPWDALAPDAVDNLPTPRAARPDLRTARRHEVSESAVDQRGFSTAAERWMRVPTLPSSSARADASPVDFDPSRLQVDRRERAAAPATPIPDPPAPGRGATPDSTQLPVIRPQRAAVQRHPSPDPPDANRPPADKQDMRSEVQRLMERMRDSDMAEALPSHTDDPQEAANRADLPWRQWAPRPPSSEQADAGLQLAMAARAASRRPAPAFEPLVAPPNGAAGNDPTAAAADGAEDAGRIDRQARDLYALRQAPNRVEAAARAGATQETEAAVEAALRWLASRQSPDGHWSSAEHGGGRENAVLGHNRGGAGTNADTGVTGLATLAFLAAGHTHLEGKYRRNVQIALEYLLRQQRANGDMAGPARLYARMYCHGMAALAASEAYAMTGDDRIEPFVRRAMAYSVAAQSRVDGGWRYQAGDPGDMSQFGWQVMALVSAEKAGVAIPAQTDAAMRSFLKKCHAGAYDGLAGYRPGESPSPAMTAEALACHGFLGEPISEAATYEAQRYLLAHPPTAGQADLYYWYYATLALRRLEGPAWEEWNKAVTNELLRRQVKEGEFLGSWNTDTKWGGYGGRIFTTSLATLCLESYYRYLPLTTR